MRQEHLTPAQYKALHQNAARQKWGNKRVEVNGESIASKGEGDYYRLLLARQECGEIRELSTQVRFELKMEGGNHVLIKSGRYPKGRKAVHRVDFSYIENATNEQIWAEFKGVDLPLGRFKRAAVEAQYGITIHVISKSWRGK